MIGTEAILLWAQYATTGDKRVQPAVNYFFKTLERVGSMDIGL